MSFDDDDATTLDLEGITRLCCFYQRVGATSKSGSSQK